MGSERVKQEALIINHVLRTIKRRQARVVSPEFLLDVGALVPVTPPQRCLVPSGVLTTEPRTDCHTGRIVNPPRSTAFYSFTIAVCSIRIGPFPLVNTHWTSGVAASYKLEGVTAQSVPGSTIRPGTSFTHAPKRIQACAHALK